MRVEILQQEFLLSFLQLLQGMSAGESMRRSE
jgi:hypothetical protein